MTKEELNELERLRSRLQAAQADRGVLQERVQNFRRKFDALEGAIEHDKTALLNQVREMCAERDVAQARIAELEAELHDRQNEIEHQIGYTITAEQERDAALERERELRDKLQRVRDWLKYEANS